MLSVPRYRGINLSVFAANQEVACNKQDMAAIISRGQANFVKLVELCASRTKLRSIDEVLTLADNHFTIVAGHCGAQVVPHVWGLFPVNNAVRRSGRLCPSDPSLPPNLALVAQVDTIRQSPETPDSSPLEAGVEEYYRTSDESLRDMSAEQFIHGSRAANLSAPPGFWLVDKEPKF